MKKNLVIAFIALMLFAVPSFADTITFTLDNNTSSGNSCTNCGPFGTVTVSQLTANSVQVTETLASGVGFVNTGAGLSLQFNISGSPAITISNLTSGFSQVSPVSKGDFGTFSYAIDCGSLCGNGGNNPYYGTLSFTVTSSTPLTAAMFETLSSKGFYFASDIIAGGLTGNIESGHYSNTSVTPEPATLLMFGTGLAGMAGVIRRKLRRS